MRNLRELIVAYADTGLNTSEIVEKLEANDGEEVDAYMHSQRRGLLAQAVRMIVGQRRRQRLHWARYAAAADQIEAGKHVLLSSFQAADDTRKTLVDMTKSDLLFFAAEEEQQGWTRLSNARLARAIARKVPKGKTVGDVFDPAQISEFLRQFGEEAAA